MRGNNEPEPAGTSPTEVLLRDLLAADGREDAESRIVEGVRALLGADWAVIVERGAGGWVCRSASGTAYVPGDVWPEGEGDEAEGLAAGLLPAGNPEGDGLGLDFELQSDPTVLLVGPRADRQEHGVRGRRLLMHVAPDLVLVLRRADELDRLRSHAFVDALTNCYNRRGFDEHLTSELRRAQRYERSVALMLVDLDGFKRINDELGHQAGDHVLRRFAELLSTTFRNTDIASRYGGDEFAVIFPETTTREAVRLAERVRRYLGRCFPDEQIPRAVSASFGIASYPGDAETAEALIATTDRALYSAKKGGRDRVVAARPRSEPDQ